MRRHAKNGRDYRQLEIKDASDLRLHLRDPDPVGILETGEDQSRRQLILCPPPLDAKDTDFRTYGVAETWHRVPLWELDPAPIWGLIGSPWGTD